MRTARAIGVDRPKRIVLSSTWPDAWTDPCPGGTVGAKKMMMSGVQMMLATSQINATRLKWFTSAKALAQTTWMYPSM
jgi:hypothetical protein